MTSDPLTTSRPRLRHSHEAASIRGDHRTAAQAHTVISVRVRPLGGAGLRCPVARRLGYRSRTDDDSCGNQRRAADPAARVPEDHRHLQAPDLALAAAHGPCTHAQPVAPALGPSEQDRIVETSGSTDPAPCAEPTPQASVALHPPFRRCLERSGSAVLRRPADGSQLPTHVRRRAPRAQGNGESLDAARADVGCRASAPKRQGLLSLAEHGALLRSPLRGELRS